MHIIGEMMTKKKYLPEIFAHVCTSTTAMSNIGETIDWVWIWKINQNLFNWWKYTLKFIV